MHVRFLGIQEARDSRQKQQKWLSIQRFQKATMAVSRVLQSVTLSSRMKRHDDVRDSQNCRLCARQDLATKWPPTGPADCRETKQTFPVWTQILWAKWGFDQSQIHLCVLIGRRVVACYRPLTPLSKVHGNVCLVFQLTHCLRFLLHQENVLCPTAPTLNIFWGCRCCTFSLDYYDYCLS